MEIFGIGLPEIIMIGVVAMVVLGPDRLPEAARTVGKFVADIRRATEPARSAWSELTSEVTSIATTVTGAAGTAASATTVSGNPWTIHPIMKDMTEDERKQFMTDGAVPERIAADLAQQTLAMSYGNGAGPATSYFDLPALDYPMPYSEMAYEPALPFAEQEDLDYPAPSVEEPEEPNIGKG